MSAHSPARVWRNSFADGYQGLSSLAGIQTHKGTAFNGTPVGTPSAPPKGTVVLETETIRSMAAPGRRLPEGFAQGLQFVLVMGLGTD